MSERKQINFTIVPEDTVNGARTYANFCAVAHTPFDFTFTFCEVMPLSEKEIRTAEAGTEHVVHAPVRARIVVPLQIVPNLIAALQEQMRGMPRMPLHRRGPCTDGREPSPLKAARETPRRFSTSWRRSIQARIPSSTTERRSSCWSRRSCPRSPPTSA